MEARPETEGSEWRLLRLVTEGRPDMSMVEEYKEPGGIEVANPGGGAGKPGPEEEGAEEERTTGTGSGIGMDKVVAGMLLVTEWDGAPGGLDRLEEEADADDEEEEEEEEGAAVEDPVVVVVVPGGTDALGAEAEAEAVAGTATGRGMGKAVGDGIRARGGRQIASSWLRTSRKWGR